MEIRSYTFPSMKGEPLLVIPLGDIQWTGEDSDIALTQLRETVEWGVENGAWFIGMGDYIDFASPSNRVAIDNANLYDNARGLLARSAQDLVDDLYDRLLEPTRGRWLGLLEGHHFYTFSDATTTDQYLAGKLNADFYGWSVAVQLQAKDWKRPVSLWAAHGLGGGQLPGSQTNRIDKVSHWFEADGYLMGHWTRLSAVPINRIVPDFQTGELRHLNRYLVGCGGYQRGYIEEYRDGPVPRGTYVEKSLMRPVTLGSPVLHIGDGQILSVEV